MLHCLHPNKDKEDKEFGTQRLWVLDAIKLLSQLNGGATAIPVEGGWLNDEGRLIQENPVVVYSYIQPKPFHAGVAKLREFLHRMGRETNQGDIAFAFEGQFFRIRTIDPPSKS